MAAARQTSRSLDTTGFVTGAEQLELQPETDHLC